MKAFLSLLFLAALFCGNSYGQQAGEVTLKGQIVCCADCWLEADRTKVEYGTAEDLAKARSCVEGGDPTLLAVREGDKFELYQLEQGKFRLTEKNWLSYIGKRVEVTGKKETRRNVKRFVVDNLTLTAPAIGEAANPVALGADAKLALKDLTGADQSLDSYRGRVVVLNFWATWCEPCKTEMPDLAAIQNDYAALGVQVIGAAGDSLADAPKVLGFVREFKVNFPVWLGATTENMLSFGVGEVLPATVIVDREGKIVWRHVGIIDPVELRLKLDAMTLPKVAQTAEVAKAEVKKTKNASLVPA